MRRSHLPLLFLMVLLILTVDRAFAVDSTISLLYFTFGGRIASVQPRKKSDKTIPQKTPSRGWTLEDAIQQLTLQPNDSYLQYVALQLARRQNKTEETVSKIQELRNPSDQIFGSSRFEGVDLFSIFSGALAVQESLQLDAMQGRRPRSRLPQGADQPNANGQDQAKNDEENRAKRRTQLVRISDIQGPTIKSHPWKQMLADKMGPVSAVGKRQHDWQRRSALPHRDGALA
jgi:hypothetical protein